LFKNALAHSWIIHYGWGAVLSLTYGNVRFRDVLFARRQMYFVYKHSLHAQHTMHGKQNIKIFLHSFIPDITTYKHTLWSHRLHLLSERIFMDVDMFRHNLSWNRLSAGLHVHKTLNALQTWTGWPITPPAVSFRFLQLSELATSFVLYKICGTEWMSLNNLTTIMRWWTFEFHKMREFLEKLRMCWLLRKDFCSMDLEPCQYQPNFKHQVYLSILIRARLAVTILIISILSCRRIFNKYSCFSTKHITAF
jgi:hypothetical protein